MTKRAPTILIALIAAAAAAAAENAPEAAQAPATQDASSIVLSPKRGDSLSQAPADSDGVTRTVSPGVAAALALGMPRYSPPKPTPTPSAQALDLRDIDKPKNEIKRLPTYVVHESRPPVFRQQDLFTKGGLTDFSLKSHPGLLYGNFLGLNSDIAYQMYLDDQRQQNMSDLSDTARAMAAGGDLGEGKFILKESQDTYMRRSDDFGPAGGLGGNLGRPQ